MYTAQVAAGTDADLLPCQSGSFIYLPEQLLWQSFWLWLCLSCDLLPKGFNFITKTRHDVLQCLGGQGVYTRVVSRDAAVMRV
jgi:hypothetical protein